MFNPQALHVVEIYETFLHYVYPIAQNIERRHGVAKAMFLEAALGQVELFNVAAVLRRVGHTAEPDDEIGKAQKREEDRRKSSGSTP